MPGVPMKRRNWKNLRPKSVQEAMRYCLDYALYRHNFSVERVADLIGTTEWTLYKWMSKGSIPANRIRSFEHACGKTYVTEYFAYSAMKLLIDIPKGSPASDDSLIMLQSDFNDSVNLLVRFYKGHSKADETIGSLTSIMKQLAGHRENVSKAEEPELSLFEEDED